MSLLYEADLTGDHGPYDGRELRCAEVVAVADSDWKRFWIIKDRNGSPNRFVTTKQMRQLVQQRGDDVSQHRYLQSLEPRPRFVMLRRLWHKLFSAKQPENSLNSSTALPSPSHDSHPADH